MAARSCSPVRSADALSEDKDRQIRKLKSTLAPLKQQLLQLPFFQHQLLFLQDRRSSLLSQTTALLGEYRLKEESAIRSQQLLSQDFLKLNQQHRDFILELEDLMGDKEALKTQIQRADSELEDHKELMANLLEKGGELEAQTTRLRAIHETLCEQNLRLMKDSQSLYGQNDEVSLKVHQLQGIAHEMLTHKKIGIQKLKLLEDDNNSLDAKICNQENAHQSLIDTLKKQQTLLTMEQESSVELGITVDRLSSDFNYIASNLRFEQSVGNDLLVQIKNAERVLDDYRLRVIKSNQQRTDTTTENEIIMGINFKLKKDWDACERHLKNLAEQNELLNRELEKFIEEDESVLKLMLQRGSRPKSPGCVLKGSRVTGV